MHGRRRDKSGHRQHPCSMRFCQSCPHQGSHHFYLHSLKCFQDDTYIWKQDDEHMAWHVKNKTDDTMRIEGGPSANAQPWNKPLPEVDFRFILKTPWPLVIIFIHHLHDKNNLTNCWGWVKNWGVPGFPSCQCKSHHHHQNRNPQHHLHDKDNLTNCWGWVRNWGVPGFPVPISFSDARSS